MNALLPEDVLNFLLREFERKNAAIVFVFDFKDHECAVERDDVADLAFLEVRCDVFERLRQLPFDKEPEIAAILGGL